MERTYRRNPLTAGRIIDGLAFVVTADDNRLHTLNSAATEIWSKAVGPISANDAAELLVTGYEVDRDTALRDATACLEDMVRRQILVADDRPDAHP